MANHRKILAESFAIMRSKKISLLFVLPLILFVTIASIYSVYRQERKQISSEISRIYQRYTTLMDKQTSQDWFKTAVRMGAIYAAEKQLFDFSDDFFSQGIIHDDNSILGGFGFDVSFDLPNIPLAGGSYGGDKGEIYYRVPMAREKIFVTFTLNKDYLYQNFPSLASLTFLNSQKIFDVKVSWLRSLNNNLFDLLFLIISFSLFGNVILIVTQSLLHSKKEKEKNAIQNHDLRESSFNIHSFVYWVKKYITSPTEENKKDLLEEVHDLEITEEINKRIFINTKEITRVNKIFFVEKELNKIIKFLGIEYNLKQFKFYPMKEDLQVQGDLYSFTVMMINLLKNSLQEVSINHQRRCELRLVDRNDLVEIFVINDGTIKNIKKLLRKGVSLRGSTGLGFSIIKKQEKILQTQITMVLNQDKVQCSFHLMKAKGL